MVNLLDVHDALTRQFARARPMPCHIAAFTSWIVGDIDRLKLAVAEAVGFTGQARRPEHIAAIGFGAIARQLSNADLQILRDEVQHLGGRAFFSAGRPLRFEVDGVALLGVALGAAHALQADERRWLGPLLERSSDEVAADEWQLGLVRLGRLAIGENNLRIVPSELAVAAAVRGLGDLRDDDRKEAWKMAVEFRPHNSGPGRDAVRLAVFQEEFDRLGQIHIASATKEDLILLLKNISRGMKRWTFEFDRRTANSAITKWELENEYHVQNLLWVVFAPIRPDLDDEENLPSIGHKKPRADLGIRSLRTIVEVKFLRDRGQRGFAKIIEEISADAGLYLSRTTEYDDIIVFVWDDCAQTEQHYELKSGIEQINGVSAAIVLPRPSIMQRQPKT
jgi:hypothetical protein